MNSATDTAIISTDSNGRVTSWSRGAQRILGWSEAEMLGEKNEQASRQSQEMEALSGVAHDFNNLLQTITGNVEILQRNLPPESARLQQAALHAMNGARRAAALIQRLLAFSRRQPLDPKRK